MTTTTGFLDRRAQPVPADPGLAAPVITRVLPAVSAELRRWTALARRCHDPFLRQEALASIESKRFHCQGGAALALLAGRRWREAVRFIVALQTISDYLDNLCDRAGCDSRPALRRLHLAMIHAVDPPPGAARALPDYYSLYPAGDDSGYLASLVRTCAGYVESQRVPVPVRGAGRRLVALYRNLQVYKHGPKEDRVELLQRWHRRSLLFLNGSPDDDVPGGPGLRPEPRTEVLWPEFAAACGSTLAVFAMYSAAAQGDGPDRSPAAAVETCASLLRGYFPWVCGLHILLDYLIDREEDSRAGDLNLTGYYRNDLDCQRRLLLFVRRAMASAGDLEWPRFHRTVVSGLLAVYLSDPKVRSQGLEPLARSLLDAAGREAWSLFALCLGLRRSGLA